MELANYKFVVNHWPPPKDRRSKDAYLIGLDEDNQPYIIKWEHQKGYEGWIAATLSTKTSGESTAVPRHYIDEDVDKLICYWADAPLLLRTVFKIKAENAKKRQDD